MKIIRARAARKGRIEIIPMIDVIFFLLATFILASLSMQRLGGLTVNLVQGKADKIKTDQQIIFTITHDNLIFLNQEQIRLEAVSSKVSSLLDDPQKIVIIASDKEARQGIVMQVMLKAKAAGAQHFSMVTKGI